MAETEEQPKLDSTDKDERPTIEPERGPESDSLNNERAQASGSETTSKASEPQPESLLLGKQLESSDQNEATPGEADTTTTESEDSGEQFEVVQLSSFSKEKHSKEMEGGMTTTPPQADGDKGEESQEEIKEPDGEKEACAEKPAPQADREDQETIAPTQTEETGADSGRTTPKEDEGTALDAEKEGERDDNSSQQQVQSRGEEEQASQDASEPGVAPIEAIGGGNEVSHAEQEEEEGESDEKMEVEATEVAADQIDVGAGGRGASSEEQQEGGGDSVEEDMPEMETESKIDAPIQPLEMESKGETESEDAVVLTSSAAAPPMEEDIQKEREEPSKSKMETECATDKSIELIESEDTRKNDTTPEVGIPPETDMETGSETATELVSPFKDDMETGNVTVALPETVPVEEETASIEASKQDVTTTKPEDDLKSISPPLFEDKQVEPELPKDDEGNIDVAEDRPPPSSRDEKVGERGKEEKEDDNEEGLPLVQLGGATSEAPVEQAADKGSVQEQEECAVEGTLSTGDMKSMEAEPTVVKQDVEHQEPVETVEADDYPEKVESDTKQPEESTETAEVEQKDENDAFKLELSFESSEPETVPSKETSIHIPADAEESEMEKESEAATVVSASKDDQKQTVEDEEMEIAGSNVEREKAVLDTQKESAAIQEPQAAEPAIITDQSSKEEASNPVEKVRDGSEESPVTADDGMSVSDDSSNQPLPSTETPPTTTDAPPSSTSTDDTGGTASVSASASAGFSADSTPTGTVSTTAVKEAVTCTVKTTVTVSTPLKLQVDPTTASKVPPIPSPPSEALPATTPTSIPTPSVVSPATTSSSSSEEPSQALPTTTPTSISASSLAPPTTISSSSSQAPPTTTPTSAPTPSVAPPITASPSFKVPSLTNVPSLSSLAARSAVPHVVSTTKAQGETSKTPSTIVQPTSIVGAKLPSFDTTDSVSLVPTVTVPAVSKSVATAAEAVVSVPTTYAIAATQTATASPSVTAKLPPFSSIVSAPSSVVAKTAIVSSGSSTSASDTKVTSAVVSSSMSTPIPVASKATAPAVTALSTTVTTKPSSTTLLISPSPSIMTTDHHKGSQHQLPPSAAKPHANTISVITQLPASFTASKTASFTSPVASSTAAAAVSVGGHHSIVLGVGSMQQREQNIIVGMQGAERLKVGEAEILQVPGDSDLRLQQQKIEVKSREEMMGKVPPQVAVIPPIIDLTRTPEYSQVEKLKGQGVSGDLGKGRKSPSILVGVATGSSEGQQRGHGGEVKSVEKSSGVMAGQELKSPIGELKASTHPVARRIWMSSCRPLDPASLERIGVDSKGTVYWYDGGKNMFQSPPSNDPAYKPSESELQLSCKSMVQWTAKLKDLRHSNIEADVKLAQTIKDQFLSRVRVATQRKPRDMSVIQKLQAVHSRPTQLSPQQQQQQQQQQQASISNKPTITLTTSQAAAAAAAMASAGGAVAVATGGTGTTGTGADGIAAAQQKTAQIVQGSFPQGSILVVPHPTHPFHAVLPVFANTAVLMPQAAAAAVATTTATASAAGAVVGSPPTASVMSQSNTGDKKAKTATAGGDSEGAKVPSSVAVAAGATQAILVQAPATSQSLAALQASPSTVIQLSGSRNNVPAVSASEKMKEGTPSKDRATSSKEKQQSSEAAVHVQQQAQKGGAITFTSPQTATIALHPSFLPQALASGMITAVPGGGLKLQDYRQALALSAMMPVMPVSVGDPVKLSTIDFESKSIEISGEVPIKMVEVDKETGELVPVTAPIKRPELEQQQQKGVVVESEKASSGTEGEESLKAKKFKAASEESHVDVEGESKKQGKIGDDKTAKSHLTKEREAAFSGHSSSDIMSAQLLLSLTDGPHKDWSAIAAPPSMPVSTQPPVDKVSDSPAKSLRTKEASIVLTPVSLKSSGRDETASPASSTSQHATASGGRKRKQKPIASAKPDDESATTTPTPKGKKGGRKAKQGAVQEESAEGGSASTEAKSSTAKKKQANDKTIAATTGDKDTPGRSKQLSPEELLILLDIPPSSSLTGKGTSKNKTPTAKAKGKAKDKSNQDGRYVLQSSNATAKMEQLKASRAGKPMKEYVIETDSESADSSSSGTSSSRFSPDSGSSSESSSDSSSEDGGGGGGEGSEAKVKPPPKKVPARSSKGGVARGRGGRGRGGRPQRKGKKGESSSGESSSEDEEELESKKKPTARARGGGARGGRGGRGSRGAGRQETTPKQQGKGQHAGHIVSIPTNLLSHKPASGKKRKAASRMAEAEKATTADYIPDLPVDLATLYATKGGVDLGTLSELTKSVKEDDLDIGIVGGSRSKRTCVRMREEITKLQEILKDNGSPEVRPSPPARSKTTSAARASTKARSSGRMSDVGGGSSGSQESSTAVAASSAPVKKYRRPAYSQFTHKRKKRRKKQPEEEALWQPASRKGGSGESYKPVYLFSTFLANKAAAAVENNRYNSIIQFHQAQPKDPGFLRLPQMTEKQSKPQRGSISDQKQTNIDSGEEEMSAKETKSTPRGQKRRNSGRISDGGSATRRTRNSEVESADKAPSPQPFLRSSRRLRQQRNRSNASPPLQSPTSPDGPRSPLPPSPPSGVRPRTRKTSQNTAGGSGSAAQQRSQRRKRQQQHEESPTSPVPDLFEARRSQQVEEMDSPSDDEERGKEDEMSDGGIGARKRARFDDGEADKNLLSSPSMQSPEQQRSIPAPNSREEENYTICHGTPVNKPVSDDISSPKNWPPSSSSSSHHHSQQHQQQIQNQQQLQHAQHSGQYPHHPHHLHQQQQQQMRSREQQMQQYVAAAATQSATGHAAQHQQQQQQQHRAPSTPSSEATTFSPSMLHPESSSSPGFDHRSVAAAAAAGAGGGHVAPGGAGLSSSGGGGGSSGGRGSADYAHRQHQLMSVATEHAHLRESNSSWATAGLHPHQFQGVPGAYPGAYPPMYNPSIPGMHYHGQPMPSANYPYPMPYHWGHHHPSAAAAAAVPQLGEHMLQQQHHHHQQQQHRQVATSKEMPSHHEVLQHPHISGHTADTPQSSSLLMRGGSSSAQSGSVTPSSTAAGKPSSRGHYPSPQAAALHQLASPGSATTSHTLSHQVPHGAEHLPPGAHQAAAAAAATFPYGFDSSAHSLSHMHMLQQSQMQPQLTRPLPGVPPHHIPPHMAPRGFWYSSQHMAAQQMIPGAIGAEIPGHPAHSKKAASKTSKSATPVDSDKNRNANNNNASIVGGAPTNRRAGSAQEFINASAYKSPAVTYPSGAHSSSSSPSIIPGATFSVENLAAPYSGAHVMGVSTTPHTPPTGQGQRFGSSSAGEGSLPAVSTILERTRQE